MLQNMFKGKVTHGKGGVILEDKGSPGPGEPFCLRMTHARPRV